MSGRGLELFLAPLRAVRRAGLAWGISLAILIAVTVAFYPYFRDEAALVDQMMGIMPPDLLEAFGMTDIASPAGYLRGNLYAIFVPLLLAFAGVLLANGQTAADEDAGRMEAYLAQPVTREALFTGRLLAVLAWLAVTGVLIVVAQLVSNAIVDLSFDALRIVETVVLCTLLGALHAALAALVAGWACRPGWVLGIGLAVAIAGYIVMALFPLSDALEPVSHLSPWDWALGGDPLTTAAEPWRYLVLVGPTVGCIALGAWLFGRRDVAAG